MYNLTVFEAGTCKVLYHDSDIDIGEVVCNIMDLMTESMLKCIDDRALEQAIEDKIADSRSSILDNGAIKLPFYCNTYNTYKVYGVAGVEYLIAEV